MNTKAMLAHVTGFGFFVLWLAGLLFANTSLAGTPSLGDLDGDGQSTVLDLVRLINHVNGSAVLPLQLRGYADVTGDGRLDQSDIDLLADAVLGIPLATR